MPLMFEPAKKEVWHPLVLQLAEKGIPGYIVIAALLIVPGAVMVYPRIRRKKDSGTRSGP
jgi:hypothetical protein